MHSKVKYLSGRGVVRKVQASWITMHKERKASQGEFKLTTSNYTCKWDLLAPVIGCEIGLKGSLEIMLSILN